MTWEDQDDIPANRTWRRIFLYLLEVATLFSSLTVMIVKSTVGRLITSLCWFVSYRFILLLRGIQYALRPEWMSYAYVGFQRWILPSLLYLSGLRSVHDFPSDVRSLWIYGDGNTFASVASYYGHTKVLRVLHALQQSHAFPLSCAVRADGWTPAMIASQRGHLEVLQLLYELHEDVSAAGGQVTAPGRHGRIARSPGDGLTPATIASQNGNVKVLLRTQMNNNE